MIEHTCNRCRKRTRYQHDAAPLDTDLCDGCLDWSRCLRRYLTGRYAREVSDAFAVGNPLPHPDFEALGSPPK